MDSSNLIRIMFQRWRSSI